MGVKAKTRVKWVVRPGGGRWEAFFRWSPWHSYLNGFCGIAIQWPAPFGGKKGCVPPTWLEKDLGHAFCSVLTRGVLFLFKEKGTYYHYKGGLTTDSTGLVVLAKEGGGVNRW